MPRRRSALVDRLVVGQPGAIEADQSDAVVLGCAGMAASAVTSRASWACPSWTVSPPRRWPSNRWWRWACVRRNEGSTNTSG